MVRFNCTSCNKKLMVPDEYSGKKAKCPKCGQTNAVPKPVVEQIEAVDSIFEQMSKQDTGTTSSSAHQNNRQPDPTPNNDTAFIDAEEIDTKKSYAARPLLPPITTKPTLSVPNYDGVKLLGTLYIASGWICCILGVLFFMLFTALGNGSEWERSFGQTPGWVVGVILGVIFILIGVFAIGIGQVFFCIRDLAQNSFHLKRL